MSEKTVSFGRFFLGQVSEDRRYLYLTRAFLSSCWRMPKVVDLFPPLVSNFRELNRLAVLSHEIAAFRRCFSYS